MSAPGKDEITRLLKAYGAGDPGALEELLPLIYERLKRIARARLRSEHPGHTLNTTGLVHEAYLKLADAQGIDWQDRAHLMAIASRSMRQILIEAARRRNAAKRGGGRKPVSYDNELPLSDEYSEILLDLDDALDRLAIHHGRAADILQHSYFAGYTNSEIAEMLEVSVSTVERDLRFARAWLGRDWEVAQRASEGPAR